MQKLPAGHSSFDLVLWSVAFLLIPAVLGGALRVEKGLYQHSTRHG